MPIHHIQENAFWGQTSLQILRMTYCQIFEMPPLNPVKSDLSRLALSHNKIASIPDGYFVGFLSLRYLDLSYNSLSSVSQVHQLSATLEYLFLDSNKLQNVPTIAHNATYSTLYRLYLPYNNITKFSKDVLNLFRTLSMIHLEANSISQIEDLRSLHRLARLTVSNIDYKQVIIQFHA